MPGLTGTAASRADGRPWDQDIAGFLQGRMEELGAEHWLDALDRLGSDADVADADATQKASWTGRRAS
jgi:hypothetical protein